MKLKLDKIPKVYEDVFSSNRVLSWCKLAKVSNNIDLEEKEYRRLMGNLIRKQQEEMFVYLVKYYWLSQKFIYNGRLRSKFKANGIVLDRAFGVYMKCHVGYYNLLVNNFGLFPVVSYVNDFFPNLMAENPFEKKMKYPYKYMNFECLILVSNIPERLQLLEYGEKKRMKLNKFIDYIYNYVLSINDLVGDTVFTLDYYFHSKIPQIRYDKSKKIKASDICQRVSQLPSSESFPAESPVKGFRSNSRPA